MLLTRTRAAVLCFGGWGLQTMLHLWPRLRFVQEARYETGIDRDLVDLDQVTAFAAILPEPVTPADVTAYRPLRIVRPYSYPDPFYVERALQVIRPTLATDERQTYAERLAGSLARQALSSTDGRYLQEVTSNLLDGQQQQVVAGLQPALLAEARVSRRAVFELAVGCAELVARTILRSVVDPTRLDSVQPEDPQVETTLYVVASLSEPLTSALLWPVVSELLHSIGPRGVVNVTAILATGSFADDDSRVIEEASAYVALTELEALTVGGAHPAMQAELTRIVAQSGKPGWAARIGKPLFQRVYLLDREKSNQALAGSEFELAVLASNAIEAFLVADGGSYLEQQVGLDPNGGGLPYSLLGAASDYVPIAQYLRSAVLEERKRIVRSLFLAEASPPEPHAAAQLLSELRATPEEAVARLTNVRGIPIFAPDGQTGLQRVRQTLRRRPPQAPRLTVRGLRVSRDYLLPPGEERQLLREPTFWRWRVFAEQRFLTVSTDITAELEQQRFAAAWGNGALLPPAPEGGPETQRRLYEAALRPFRECGWVARRQASQALMPALLARLLTNYVRAIGRSPNGLRTALDEVAAVITACEHVQDELRTPELVDLGGEWDQRFRQRFTDWQQRAVSAEFNAPRAAALWTRTAFLVALLAFPSLAWLIYEQPTPVATQVVLLVAAACVAMGLLIMLLGTLPARLRTRRLRARRVEMAQEMLSRNARELVQARLLELYGELADTLRLLRDTFQRTLTTLQEWSQPQDPPGIPPQDHLGRPLQPVYLRIAHTSHELWLQVKGLIQGARVEQHGGRATSAELLGQIWRDASPQEPDWQNTGGRLDQRLRMALELALNEQELAAARLIEARRRQLDHPATQPAPQPQGRRRLAPPPQPVEDEAAAQALQLRHVTADLAGNSWCPFADGPPNQQGSRCTACLRTQNEVCPYADEGARRRASDPWHPWSLTAVIRDAMLQATTHLDADRRLAIGPPGHVARLLQEHNIEREALRDARADGGDAQRRRGFFEHLYARAKPSGLYEVSDPVRRQALEVAFSVTSQADESSFAQMLAQRKIRLLSSFDPMSLTAVRTVNLLHRDDLLLLGRCGREFVRLAQPDRDRLTLTSVFPAPATEEIEVPYEPILV